MPSCAIHVLRTARPSAPFIGAVEFDALTLDLDLFDHGIFLTLGKGLLRRDCACRNNRMAVRLSAPLDSAQQEQNQDDN
jgi:hypothetical protein